MFLRFCRSSLLSSLPFLCSAPKKGAVKLPVPTKGSRSSGRSTAKQNSSVHSTPRSQQSTPKQNASAGKGSASKGSGKKATPVSNGKPPPRAGSRTSSRLSQEILATNGPASTQPETKKRPATGAQHMILLILSNAMFTKVESQCSLDPLALNPQRLNRQESANHEVNSCLLNLLGVRTLGIGRTLEFSQNCEFLIEPSVFSCRGFP